MGPTFKSAVHGGCEGMEPDDLLCSRNARSKTPLVGRAHWKTHQPPSLKRTLASLEGSIGWGWSIDARYFGSSRKSRLSRRSRANEPDAVETATSRALCSANSTACYTDSRPRAAYFEAAIS